ncbi:MULTISPECIES: hypothetical protein [Lysobacter]|uniref:Uncharacterized protein n=1 Tax=Lysobacter gummosus TaxID=262324 RepID=A0ABY3XI22_9GAMM|nr:MULTISPECIES: hypothetical protein [Lysobacter]ALN90821.1 hypothetical protein LG3211_1850 [Lysobacter gummosus]UJB17446.1 hypothetical protein L1A79_13730 [Lysobacter capsici]UJQ28831.1 hypothetical protein L2D09_01135 [Lysobacter gummosus]UNP31279.1 hypothetical protein MOV92_08595 [Lysobacter gummosus]
MKQSILPLALIALISAFPASSDGQRGVYEEVPYNNNPDQFCKLGYPPHNWMSVVPKAGIWAPIVPNAPVNSQYIATFIRVCTAGGIPMPISPGTGNKAPKDPAATF